MRLKTLRRLGICQKIKVHVEFCCFTARLAIQVLYGKTCFLRPGLSLSLAEHRKSRTRLRKFNIRTCSALANTARIVPGFEYGLYMKHRDTKWEQVTTIHLNMLI